MITKLQEINNDLSVLLKSFGTDSMDDLITVCFGSDFIESILTDEGTKILGNFIERVKNNEKN